MNKSKRIFALNEKKKRLLKKIHQISFFVAGNFKGTGRTCGKKNCRCQKGKKHFVYTLQWKDKGNWTYYYPSSDQIEKVSDLFNEYKKLKKLMDEITRVEVKILQETKR